MQTARLFPIPKFYCDPFRKQIFEGKQLVTRVDLCPRVAILRAPNGVLVLIATSLQSTGPEKIRGRLLAVTSRLLLGNTLFGNILDDSFSRTPGGFSSRLFAARWNILA